MSGQRSVTLFTRDLRVHDHPALAAAVGDGATLPLFVFDERSLRLSSTGPNRLAFLLDSLVDLRASLRERGGELYVRRGNPAAVAVAAAKAFGATVIHTSADVSTAARRRESELIARARESGIAVELHPGVGVVAPGTLRPGGGGDHYRVFTPFWRAWSVTPRRSLAAPIDALDSLDDLEPGTIPSFDDLLAGLDPVGRRSFEALSIHQPSPRRDLGGERVAWERLNRWAGIDRYVESSNALGADDTSRISAHLHFGCISPLALEVWAVESQAKGSEGADAFIRQLCWREFYLNVTAAFPAYGRDDYRPRPIDWREDAEELARWKAGETGVDIVDAAMHQLLEEGFVHNRARLVASSYLVKTLRHHWREGAAHYLYWLSDGDIASNSGNWQWMAGTGNDTRPNRVLNPVRQADRFDASHSYRDRYLGAPPAAVTPLQFDLP